MQSGNRFILGFLGLYLVFSLISYPIIMVRLEDFTVLATLYIALYLLHELLISVSLILLLLNLKIKSKGLVYFVAFMLVCSGLLIYPTLLLLFPYALFLTLKVNQKG